MQNETTRTIGLFSGTTEVRFARRLEEAGWRVKTLPCSAAVPNEPDEQAKLQLKGLSGYDWIVFDSPAAVERLIAAAETVRGIPFDWDEMLVCAMGEPAAEKLRAFQVHTDIICGGDRIGQALAEIEAYIGSHTGQQILYVCGENRDIEGPWAGGHLIEVLLLRSEEAPRTAELARARALLLGGAVDSILLGRSDVASVECLFPRSPDLSIPRDLHVFAEEEIIGRLRELGIEPLPLSSLLL